MSARKIKIYDIELNYVLHRQGKPILFLHGNGLSKESMEKIYEPIFSNITNYQRIYIDLPGMGDSGASNKIQNSDMMLEYLLKFIQELSIDHSLTVFGHSYGGYLCLGLMHIMQKEIQAAYLTCPVIYGEYTKRRVENSKTIVEESIGKDKSEFFDDYLEMNTRINSQSWALYNNTIVPGIKKAKQKFMENIMRKDQTYYKFSFEETISIHTKTILTVLLGKYDNVVGYKDQFEFFQDYPNATLSLFSDGGHNLFIDNFDFISDYVNNFIKRIEY